MKKSLKELWQQRNRLVAMVENDKRNGRWCHRDGGYFIANERGSKLMKRIATAYRNEKTRLIDKFIELGYFTEADITSEFYIYDGVVYPNGIMARDEAKAYVKYQDLKIN